MSNTPQVISAAEAARILSVSPRTVARWIKSGRLTPVTKLDGLRGPYLLDAQDVYAYAEQQRAAADVATEAVTS